MFIPVSHTKHIARQASISTSEVYQKKVKNKPETNSGAEEIFPETSHHFFYLSFSPMSSQISKHSFLLVFPIHCPVEVPSALNSFEFKKVGDNHIVGFCYIICLSGTTSLCFHSSRHCHSSGFHRRIQHFHNDRS